MKQNSTIKTSDRFLFYFCIIICVFSNLSFKWPLTKGRITSTYGESRWDHFHDGVDMVSTDTSVMPVKDGKLVYYWDKNIFPFQAYPGAGNYKVLEHEGGYYSIYMHLQDALSPKVEYSTKDPIGSFGNTGHSFKAHIHFTLYNPHKGETVNPYTLLPAWIDKKPPVIGRVHLRIEDKIMQLSEGARIRLTKHYPILLKIRDTISGLERLGIHTLKVDFNGANVLNLTFAALTDSPKGLVMQGKNFEEIMDRSGFYKVGGLTFKDGLNTIKVVASDFSGNVSAKDFTLFINLDLEK